MSYTVGTLTAGHETNQEKNSDKRKSTDLCSVCRMDNTEPMMG